MNKKLIVAVTMMMGLSVTGCGASQQGSSQNVVTESVSPEVSETVADVVEESGTVTVVHALGETEVTKNPKNIVVMDLGILDGLDALGVEVAGIPLSGSLPSYLSAYENEEIYTNVGSLKEIDLETIFELEPELIITGGRQADYYEELSKIAPTVQLSVDASDYMNSFKANMGYLGEIFGKEAEVEIKIAEIEAVIAEVAAQAAEKDVTGLIALANGDSFSVYGVGSRFGIIHNEFGIAPSDASIEVSTHGQNASFEYIVEQNPDYLFIVDRTAATSGEGSAPALFDNELIRQTDVAQNDRIIYLDPVVWYTAGGGFTATQVMVDDISAALAK